MTVTVTVIYACISIHTYIHTYIHTVCSLFERGDSYLKNRPYLSPTTFKRDRFYGRRWPRQAVWKAWEACIFRDRDHHRVRRAHWEKGPGHGHSHGHGHGVFILATHPKGKYPVTVTVTVTVTVKMNKHSQPSSTGGQQGEAAKKQQENPQASKKLLIPMCLAYLVPCREGR